MSLSRLPVFSCTGHSSLFAMPVSAVKITGNPKYHESFSDAGIKVRRGFCPECGNPLFAMNDAYKKNIAIKVATLEDGIKPTEKHGSLFSRRDLRKQ
ncbi:MAG: GFA family protein [Desulfobacteraceae bacterium]